MVCHRIKKETWQDQLNITTRTNLWADRGEGPLSIRRRALYLWLLLSPPAMLIIIINHHYRSSTISSQQGMRIKWQQKWPDSTEDDAQNEAEDEEPDDDEEADVGGCHLHILLIFRFCWVFSLVEKYLQCVGSNFPLIYCIVDWWSSHP